MKLMDYSYTLSLSSSHDMFYNYTCGIRRSSCVIEVQYAHNTAHRTQQEDRLPSFKDHHTHLAYKEV